MRGQLLIENYFSRIEEADVSAVVERATPLEHARCLSARFNNRALLKREDMMRVFSFKARGAYYKMARLSKDKRKVGVVAASAGNHAQGVALAATCLNISATIVMPETTPTIKVEAVRGYDNVEVVLHGDNFDEACERAVEMAAERKAVVIHAFDDPDVIIGQGTVGREICEQCENRPYAVFVPVGGGGLIAGVAAYLKRKMPSTKIIGVEPEDAPTLHTSLKRGRRVKLRQVGLFADAVAVKQIGKNVFPLVRKFVDKVVLVTTDEICAAIKYVFEDTRALLEPAGALAIAGMRKYVEETKIRDKDLVAIASGANISFNRLKHVVERSEIGENRELLLAVTIPERPGSFLKFCRLIGRRMVTEFNYRYADSKKARVFVGIRCADTVREKHEVISKLQEKGLSVVDMTDNEMAKLHLRHMVGGRLAASDEGKEGKDKDAGDEKLYRLEFPERPGALLEFLEATAHGWNISLFHYRNHGAAYGRVLIGAQITDAEAEELEELFKNLGYRFYRESQNEVYKLFLR